MESVTLTMTNQKTSGCILCKVVTINDEEDDSGGDNDKPNERKEDDVRFLFKILLEIPPNPGINLVLDGNLINADHLLLLKSDLVKWCDQCGIVIQQARQLHQQIREVTTKFRKIQRKIVDTIQKCIINDNESAFNEVENYKAIWRKLCLQNEGRFNNLGFPFIVQDWVTLFPDPEPEPIIFRGKKNKTQLSSCHGDRVHDSDELPCKNEDLNGEDVKHEDDVQEGKEEVSETEQQRILLIFPQDGGANMEDNDRESLSSGRLSSSRLSCSSDEGSEEEEIIESSKNSSGLSRSQVEDDDPLADNCKEEPVEPESDLEIDSTGNHEEKKKIYSQNYCKVCKTSYSSKDSLIQHQKRYHSGGANKLKPIRSSLPSDYGCLDPQCSKYFTNSTYLRIHLKRCHPQIPLPSFLKVSSFRKDHPQIHSKILKNPETKLWHCPCSSSDSTDPPPETICLKSFKLKKSLEYHIRYKHLGESGIYRCTWGQGCTQSFCTWNNYQSHMDRHKGVPRWQCDQCDKQFYAKNSFISHKQREHEDGRNRKPFNCDICGKSFSCMDYVYIHKANVRCAPTGGVEVPKKDKKPKPSRKIKTGKVNRDNKSVPSRKKGVGGGGGGECKICGKKVSSLWTHMNNVHSSERRHMCHLCAKGFKSGAYLKSHLKRHEGTDVSGGGGGKSDGVPVAWSAKNKFQCGVKGCRMRFPRAELLESHNKSRHGNDGEPEFKCQYCGKGFHLKKNLKHHEETHENEGRDPFKCQVCGKGFRTMIYLKYHQIHTHKMKFEDRRYVSKR